MKKKSKKKPHHTKLHGAALKAWKKKHGMRVGRSAAKRPAAKARHAAARPRSHPTRSAPRHPPRARPHTAPVRHHHRCPYCGHDARHDANVGCLHFDGKHFCTCRHR